jgi:hypothetical protein
MLPPFSVRATAAQIFGSRFSNGRVRVLLPLRLLSNEVKKYRVFESFGA